MRATKPHTICTVEPLRKSLYQMNDSWRFTIKASDFLIEQKLGINVFKPHVKLHFVQRWDSLNVGVSWSMVHDKLPIVQQELQQIESPVEDSELYVTSPTKLSIELPATEPTGIYQPAAVFTNGLASPPLSASTPKPAKMVPKIPDSPPSSPEIRKCFQCPSCTSTFKRNYDLKRHMRIHLNLKPFKCDHCEKQFTRADALSRHISVKSCLK